MLWSFGGLGSSAVGSWRIKPILLMLRICRAIQRCARVCCNGTTTLPGLLGGLACTCKHIGIMMWQGSGHEFEILLSIISASDK